MKKRSGPMATVMLAAVMATTASIAAAQQSAPLTPAEKAAADSGRPPYTPADVYFMQGMIHHHAQAVTMARWAPTHGARADVLRLCERIDVAQRDEIVTMQRWLRDRREMVPEPDFATGTASMPNMPDVSRGPQTLMPGMLTPEQMSQLNHASGPDFDRLFLTFMIQHHQGALTMVQQLFDAPGAAQDEDIFKFATDVGADQTAEIDRMHNMLGD
jgi:uncharacterized protein (DUF305 family)